MVEFQEDYGIKSCSSCNLTLMNLSDDELIEYSEIDWRVLLYRKPTERTDLIDALIFIHMEL